VRRETGTARKTPAMQRVAFRTHLRGVLCCPWRSTIETAACSDVTDDTVAIDMQHVELRAVRCQPHTQITKCLRCSTSTLAWRDVHLTLLPAPAYNARATLLIVYTNTLRKESAGAAAILLLP
jgi:hypothetical protein